ncbi:MAG: hypothetical protein HYV63_05710 [Candidatus Schekmanbacteria bacterium]|nr:hypothetical protein [Candidatus Schekmanbacteria bacterium]
MLKRTHHRLGGGGCRLRCMALASLLLGGLFFLTVQAVPTAAQETPGEPTAAAEPAAPAGDTAEPTPTPTDQSTSPAAEATPQDAAIEFQVEEDKDKEKTETKATPADELQWKAAELIKGKSYAEAERILKEAVDLSPKDEKLGELLRQVRGQLGNQAAGLETETTALDELAKAAAKPEPTPTSVPENFVKDESYWKGRKDTLQTEVADLKKQLADVDRLLWNDDGSMTEYQDLQKKQEELRKALAEKQGELGNVDDEAKDEGAPPGWTR